METILYVDAPVQMISCTDTKEKSRKRPVSLTATS